MYAASIAIPQSGSARFLIESRNVEPLSRSGEGAPGSRASHGVRSRRAAKGRAAVAVLVVVSTV